MNLTLTDDIKKLYGIIHAFNGGMNQLSSASNLSNEEYFFLLNGRTRRNKVEPVKSPLEESLPEVGNLQGIYGYGNIKLIFLNGKAWYRKMDESEAWHRVEGLQLSETVDTIFTCAIPTSTKNFTREFENLLPSLIAGSPAGIVVQDGINQPWIIFANGSSRVLQTYEEWNLAEDKREYVPVGTQMVYIDGILYVVNANQILRSVSGRPLDFVVNIQSDGDKGGDASTTSHSVDFDTIKCIARAPSDNGSLFVSTSKNCYLVFPDYSNTIFSEPTFRNNVIADTGTSGPFSFINLDGDSIFMDYHGLRSFNAIATFKNLGENSPVSKNVAPLMEGILQLGTSSVIFDNYALFSFNSIYGKGLLVFDTLRNVFVGLDIYPEVTELITQFAEVRSGSNRYLYFRTASNKLFKAFSGSVAECIYCYGESSSKEPKIEQFPQSVKLIFEDVSQSGVVNVKPYYDRLFNGELETNVEVYNTLVTTRFPLNTTESDNVRPLVFDLTGQSFNCWNFSLVVTWKFEGALSLLRVESSVVRGDNTVEQMSNTYRQLNNLQ